jgi:hypothetical protein
MNKTLTPAQFEELVTQTVLSICREVELDDRQFDVVVTTVAETMKKCLDLPWIRNVRKN